MEDKKQTLKTANELIKDFPQWSEIKNTDEIKHFVENSVKVLTESGVYKQTDYMSIYNCLLTLDELFSKLKERNSYYTETNKKIKEQKLETIKAQKKENVKLLENFSKQLSTLKHNYKNIMERINTLNSRIENKKKEITLGEKKFSKELETISKSFKDLQKEKIDKQELEIKLVMLRQQKQDLELKWEKTINRLNKDKESWEDELWKLQQQIPENAKLISDLTEKINKYSETKADLESTELIINESLKYKYINISKNGEPYTNEVYSIKSFIKDAQDLLDKNGLTPLSRTKIEALLSLDNKSEDIDLYSMLSAQIEE